MKKENSADKSKKIEEAKRINLILWTIGSDLSGLGVVASVEWVRSRRGGPNTGRVRILSVDAEPMTSDATAGLTVW